MNNNVLAHYGILGMRWGRRKGSKSTVKAERVSSDDHNKKVALKKKKIHEMSNAELKSLNERLQLEKQYKDLSKGDVSRGQKFAADLLREVGREIIKDSLKSGAKKIINLRR